MAWRRWLLVGLVAVVMVCLLVVGIAAWKNREFTPGTLPDVAQILTHDRELEGQAVTVSLAKMAKDAGEELPFVYVWQPELETGYLYLTGNAVAAASEQLQEQIGVFYRIMERFGVEAIISCD